MVCSALGDAGSAIARRSRCGAETAFGAGDELQRESFDPVVSKDSLGPLGSPIGENNGKSEGVYPSAALAANASTSDRALLTGTGSRCYWHDASPANARSIRR